MIGELSETRRRRGSVQLVGADTALRFQKTQSANLCVACVRAWRGVLRGGSGTMTFACTTPKEDMIGEANLGALVVIVTVTVTVR